MESTLYPKTRRLIVNADDFGAGAETDRGILEAFTDGVVTSASLLANGPSTKSAADSGLRLGLPLGIHLNLADGVPLSGLIQGLTRPDGRFPGKRRLRAFLHSRQVRKSDLRRELGAQIEQLLELGVQPDHLDTHQHFFLFPEPLELILELAAEYRIPALRRPSPVEPVDQDPGGPLGDELKFYRQTAPKAGKAIDEAGLKSPDGLLGMPLLNQLREEDLHDCLKQLPPGRWELMVHPGYPDRDNRFSGRERLLELNALTTESTRERVREQGIKLISFGGL